MPQPILPIDDFLALSTDEQVEKLKQWKMDYTLKDIRDAWGFKHSAQYYMLLKKLRIYERVVNKSDKFSPEQLLASRNAAEAYSSAPYAATGRSVPEDQFGYELNVTLSGPELAEKLERLAYFLKGENKTVAVKLSISASGGQSQQPDEEDEEN
ncbi:hypothetical protein [Paenibacillus sacheonensis]|uniref:Uncharacterized protein n=1 Tax=Paenibacillus sacheonensis TaxID=742054 RepID=A0A7X4YQQ3_9BACL|nr:hypothetical protein [Paenibacillus sacheonensis]MBM7567357.1 hypothetical protein [Paenibacillus sacheonensis]NBC69861.1 hypothetical protein [Paenibacillus sacheonensis]